METEEKTGLTVTPNASAHSVAVKSSVAYTLYFLALIYIFKLLGIEQTDINLSGSEKAISYIASYIPFVLAIVYTQTTFKTLLGGYITFGKAFMAGFRTAVYTGLLVAIVMVIYYKFLDQEAMGKMMDAALLSAGEDEKAVQGVNAMRPYMLPMIAFGFAINYTFFGLLISLISAAFVKKPLPDHREL